MRGVARILLLTCASIALNGCAGSEKGNGLDRLNTESAEEKENESWFGSFYGKNHCGVWAGSCEPGADTGGGGGGGMWGGGVGPTDSPSHDSGSSSSSDSGSSN